MRWIESSKREITKINLSDSNGIRKAAPPNRNELEATSIQKASSCLRMCRWNLHVTDRLLKEKEFSVEDPWKESLTSVAFHNLAISASRER